MKGVGPMGSAALRVGEGNYGAVVATTWEGQPCVVKAIHRYGDRPHLKKKHRRGERDDADQEEVADVKTEVCILEDLFLDDVSPWRWRPRFHAYLIPDELDTLVQKSIHIATGFNPGAMLYMEQLSVRFDLYIHKVAGSEAGARETMALICDCLYILVGFNRKGLRHNDCMMRNVMLRQLSNERRVLRSLRLETTPPSIFEWESHPGLELVLIDFGLSSVEASSPLRFKGVVTNATRNQMYAKTVNGTRLTPGLHPLEMSCEGFARTIIDLQCLAFNFQNIATLKAIHPLLRRWCRQAYKVIDGAQREADLSKTPVSFDAVVGTLMPQVARRRIAT